MSIVKMYGPSISDPSRVVNRDVPECDVQAYKAAGYVIGSITEIVYTEADAAAQAEIEPPKAKAKRGK